MDKVKQIQPGQMRLRGRQQRRRDDHAFSEWMSPAPPENNNEVASFLIPGSAKATKDAILLSQEIGQSYKENKKADPYARAHSDVKKRNDGDQFTFAFIADLPLAAKTKVDEEV